MNESGKPLKQALRNRKKGNLRLKDAFLVAYPNILAFQLVAHLLAAAGVTLAL